jgi:hypothetical protein
LLSAVRKQRPIVCDNSAFMKQVEDELYGRVQGPENAGSGLHVDGDA